MAFFYSKSKSKLPLRGRRLLIRGPRKRRLNLLRQFEVGRVYTFCDIAELDDLPDEMLLWPDGEATDEVRVWM